MLEYVIILLVLTCLLLAWSASDYSDMMGLRLRRAENRLYVSTCHEWNIVASSMKTTRVVKRRESSKIGASRERKTVLRRGLMPESGRCHRRDVNRRGAALDLLPALHTGPLCSMSTIHANNPQRSLFRLEISGIEIPQMALWAQVAPAIDAVVHTAWLSDGFREVIVISKVLLLKIENIKRVILLSASERYFAV